MLFDCPSWSTASIVSLIASSTDIRVRHLFLKQSSMQDAALSVSMYCEAMLGWCFALLSIEQFQEGGRGAIAGQLGAQ